MENHISVCILTFRRNQMLERLLKKIVSQQTGGLFEFSVVVVDNDANGLARATVIRLRKELGLEINYGIEPERTIPVARNHALTLARGNYIGIIDDDEFPPPHWLITLYRAIHTFDVDGCLGPVYPFFEKTPPAWLVKGRFCERPAYRTGTLLQWNQTRTGNVLLKKAVFDKHDLCFDEEFKTGGSDQELFRQAIQAGCRFVFVKEAPVYEIVPPERWARSYYLKRALINGFNSHRYILRESHGFSRVLAPVKSMAALLAYTLALPFSVCLGSHVIINCLERGGYHLSRLLALVGIELLSKRNF